MVALGPCIVSPAVRQALRLKHLLWGASWVVTTERLLTVAARLTHWKDAKVAGSLKTCPCNRNAHR